VPPWSRAAPRRCAHPRSRSACSVTTRPSVSVRRRRSSSVIRGSSPVSTYLDAPWIPTVGTVHAWTFRNVDRRCSSVPPYDPPPAVARSPTGVLVLVGAAEVVEVLERRRVGTVVDGRAREDAVGLPDEPRQPLAVALYVLGRVIQREIDRAQIDHPVSAPASAAASSATDSAARVVVLSAPTDCRRRRRFGSYVGFGVREKTGGLRETDLALTGYL